MPDGSPSKEEAAELDRLRQEKIARYRRVASLRLAGTEFPERPIEATTQTAIGLTQKYPVTALEFWATWCRPCVKMRPVVEEVAAQFWGDVAFARINLDENPDARDRWGVTVLPTFIITKAGQEAARIQGAVTRSRLIRELEPFAKSPEKPLRRVGSTRPPGSKGED